MEPADVWKVLNHSFTATDVFMKKHGKDNVIRLINEHGLLHKFAQASWDDVVIKYLVYSPGIELHFTRDGKTDTSVVTHLVENCEVKDISFILDKPAVKERFGDYTEAVCVAAIESYELENFNFIFDHPFFGPRLREFIRESGKAVFLAAPALDPVFYDRIFPLADDTSFTNIENGMPALSYALQSGNYGRTEIEVEAIKRLIYRHTANVNFCGERVFHPYLEALLSWAKTPVPDMIKNHPQFKASSITFEDGLKLIKENCSDEAIRKLIDLPGFDALQFLFFVSNWSFNEEIIERVSRIALRKN